jgi:small GTP-binding protein
MAEDDSYDQLYKIILIGDASVGKSNILSRYLSNAFKQDTKSTVGVEFGSKKVSVNGVNIKLQIWDTAGQERYRSLAKVFYKNATVCVLVYDVTRKSSFEELKNYWVKEIKENSPEDISR